MELTIMSDKYAVVGNPVEHSLSPKIHKLFAEQTQQDLIYEKIRIEIDKFSETIKQLRQKGCKGLNVTLPFKQEAFELCDVLSERAKLAGAVNTLIFKADGTIFGDNTDGLGLIQDIQNNLLFSINNKTVLLIGAGGAAQGVIKPLLDAEPKSITITNRTASKAHGLANRFNSGIKSCGFDELTGHYDCIINATSMGLSDIEFPLSGSIIKPNSLCYDMVYAKKTAFMKWAAQNNAAIVSDGLGMLVEQAAESFYLWRNKRPNSSKILQQLRKILKSY